MYGSANNIAHYSSRFLPEDVERGMMSILADDLELSYFGNQLDKVVDKSTYKSTSTDEYFFTKWSITSSPRYGYNQNGAMIKDDNKGMTVEYNTLNLPRKVKINNTVVLSGSTLYDYSADGIKRRGTHQWLVPSVYQPEVSIDTTAIFDHPYLNERGDDDLLPSNKGFTNGSYITKKFF